MTAGRRKGPIEETAWPDAVAARVVTSGDAPRIHGIDVEADLARHYGFGETVLLALTGQAPGEAQGRAFELALVFASPTSIAEAPAHAAMLTRLCGAAHSGVLATGAVALAEQARHLVDAQAALALVLSGDEAALPDGSLARTAGERAAVERLAAHLDRIGFACPELSLGPSRDAALFIVLHRCGLDAPWQKETALVVARLAVVAAEAAAVRPGDFESYPMDLPPFVYEEGDG